MSKLEGLLKELCPGGVEYKQLKVATSMQRGTSMTKAQSQEGPYPVISGGREPAFYCDRFNRDGETITVAGSGAGAGFVQYWDRPIFVNDAFSIVGNGGVSTKYAFYCLANMQEQIYATKKGGGVPHVHISDVEDFRIPLPPLPVQREIVRILDTFTAMNANLEEELAARKMQYIAYRNVQLQKVAKVSEICLLKDVCSFAVGGDVPKERLSKVRTDEFNVPIYSNGSFEKDLYGYTDIPKITAPCVTLSARGTIGYCALRRTPFVPIVRLICVFPSTRVEIRYLFHYLESLEYPVPLSGIPQLTVPMLKNYTIPLPSHREQMGVADILDKIQSSVEGPTSIQSELALRRKQYEYYRDKLLAFKEA